MMAHVGFDLRSGFRHDPAIMANLSKMLLILAACLALSACDELGWNPLDPEALSAEPENAVNAPAIVLAFSLPTLNDSASFYDERIDQETQELQRRRSWRGPPENDVSASLIEIRRLDGGEMAAPPPPSQATAFWQRLSDRNLDFRDVYESTNAVGPVIWQRFVTGANICVIFSQGWSPDGWTPDGTPPKRHLVGYYCAASGEELSAGQAETVVRAVRVRDQDPPEEE